MVHRHSDISVLDNRDSASEAPPVCGYPIALKYLDPEVLFPRDLTKASVTFFLHGCTTRTTASILQAPYVFSDAEWWEPHTYGTTVIELVREEHVMDKIRPSNQVPVGFFPDLDWSLI